MSWPKTVFRKTKHKNPRHQLYQPGFNANNGCWLDGSWVTVAKDEWESRKDEHVRMYGNLRKMADEQHYRDPAVPRDKMTKAQRQAWEHYAGDNLFDCRHESGSIGPVSVGMAGNRIDPKEAKWMLGEGWKVMRFVKQPNGETTDQTKGLDIPDDLITDEAGNDAAQPVDTWQHIVDQNVGKMDAMFESSLREATSDAPMPGGQIMGMDYRGFATQMLFTQLVQQEESIIRMEWSREQGGKDQFRTHQQEIDRYVEMRRKIKAECESPEVFEAWYENARESHNSCARTNLDNTEGTIYSYVLPKFNDDGTHNPWGPRDVPWGHEGTP